MRVSRTEAWLKQRRVQTSGANAGARRPRHCPTSFSFLFFSPLELFWGRLDGHRKVKTNICLSLREGGPTDSSSVHHQRPPQAVKVMQVKIPAASPGWLPLGVYFFLFLLKCDQSGKQGHRRSCCSTTCLFCPFSLLFFFFFVTGVWGAMRRATLITSDRDGGSNTPVEWCCNSATMDWNTVGGAELREMNRGREEQR